MGSCSKPSSEEGIGHGAINGLEYNAVCKVRLTSDFLNVIALPSNTVFSRYPTQSISLRWGSCNLSHVVISSA